MFQFTGFAHACLYIQQGVTWLPKPGSPIQRSSDQGLFTSSPKLFAGIHVFHRLFPPRHPPYALIRLSISRTMQYPEFSLPNPESVSHEIGLLYYNIPMRFTTTLPILLKNDVSCCSRCSARYFCTTQNAEDNIQSLLDPVLCIPLPLFWHL